MNGRGGLEEVGNMSSCGTWGWIGKARIGSEEEGVRGVK